MGSLLAAVIQTVGLPKNDCRSIKVQTDSSATRLSLISRVRREDSRAWQELVELYRPLVAFWCKRRGVRQSDINDTVQDVFFAVCRSLDTYSASRTNGCFRAWLWTITRNKIIDSLRKASKIPQATGGSTALHAASQIPVKFDADEDSERTEFARLTRRALGQVECEFEPKSWRAFWRSTIDNVPIAVVAEELHITPATVRKHRSRILRRLREQLGEFE